jgi:hypothetical protein
MTQSYQFFVNVIKLQLSQKFAKVLKYQLESIVIVVKFQQTLLRVAPFAFNQKLQLIARFII